MLDRQAHVPPDVQIPCEDIRRMEMNFPGGVRNLTRRIVRLSNLELVWRNMHGHGMGLPVSDMTGRPAEHTADIDGESILHILKHLSANSETSQLYKIYLYMQIC